MPGYFIAWHKGTNNVFESAALRFRIACVLKKMVADGYYVKINS